MKLDFTALEKALQSLNVAIVRSKAAPSDKEVRDAVIQRFEYTFELSYKFLKRVVEAEAAVPSEVDKLSYKDLLREAGEKGLITDFQAWVVFRDQRNITSHTYSDDKAQSVWQTAIQFYPVAQELLQRLKARPHA
jgi:nucleotidyltransferase substrate binding protein (TIGR01987 family)